MNKIKKSQSEIIVTVLLVLIALAAVGLIAYFVMGQVRTNIADANLKSKVYDLSVEKVQFIDGLMYGVYIKRSGNEEPLKGVDVVLTDSNGNSKTYKNYSSFKIFESKPVYVPAEIKNLAKVEIYPIIDSNGREVTGNIAGGKTIVASSGSAGSSSGGTIGNGGANGVVPVSTNLVAYYPLDGNTNDYSGNGKNGAIVGSVDCNVAGKAGKACNFSGNAGNYINTNSLLLGNTNTIYFWMKAASAENPLNNGGDKVIGIFETDNGTYSQNMGIWGNNGAWVNAFHYRNYYPNQIILANNSFLLDNSFHNYAIVKSGANVKIYQDGAFLASGDFPAGDWPVTLDRIGTGRCDGCGGQTYIRGSLDEVRLYNKTLSADEISSLIAFDNAQ